MSNNYWQASNRHEAAFAPLDRDADYDVAIVGAGFTGLSTAYHLQASGLRCVILEAQQVGFGASGRTGGQAVPRYKHTFPELDRAYGRETALAMHRAAHEAADTLQSIIDTLGLDCGYARCGHVTPIQHEADVQRFARDAAWLAREAGDAMPRMLDAAEVAARVGSPIYRGGYFEPRGGAFHPLEYCVTLANALAQRGTAIHGETPVTRWSNDADAVVVDAGKHRVRARHLVLATNGYSDATAAGDGVKRRIVPIVSSQIATEPLTAAQRATVLPFRNTATDAKRLTHYYRVMGDGRFIFGGRAGASDRESPTFFRRLERELGDVFPQLAGCSIEHRWSGRVAVTTDGLPHVGRLAERVFYGLGYNGRGVALSALFGKALARMVTGEAVDLGPMTNARFEAIPFHALQVPAKAVAITYKRLLDAVGA